MSLYIFCKLQQFVGSQIWSTVDFLVGANFGVVLSGVEDWVGVAVGVLVGVTSVGVLLLNNKPNKEENNKRAMWSSVFEY